MDQPEEDTEVDGEDIDEDEEEDEEEDWHMIFQNDYLFLSQPPVLNGWVSTFTELHFTNFFFFPPFLNFLWIMN